MRDRLLIILLIGIAVITAGLFFAERILMNFDGVPSSATATGSVSPAPVNEARAVPRTETIDVVEEENSPAATVDRLTRTARERSRLAGLSDEPDSMDRHPANHLQAGGPTPRTPAVSAAPPGGVRPVSPNRIASGERSPASHRGERARPPSTTVVRAPGTASPGGSSGDPSDEPDTPTKPDDPDSDTAPPVITSIQVVPPTITDGQEVTILVTVTDNLSGVKHVSGSVRSPGGRAVLGFSTVGGGESPQYQGKVRIPEKAEEGIWYVNSVRATDNANNVGTVQYNPANAPSSARFEVRSTASDSTPPVVRAITVDRETISQGEPNVIRVIVEDDKSGVRSVAGSFSSPSKNARVNFSCNLDGASSGGGTSGNGTWVGTVVLPKDADCGEWTLQTISVSDAANNRKTYAPGNPEIDGVHFFLSFGGSCDSTPPTLSVLTLDPTVVSNQGPTVITVTAFVHDDDTGVRQVSGRAVGPSSPGSPPPYIYFALTRTDKSDGAPWVGRITVPQYAAKGRWTIQTLQVYDNANNQRTYTPADPVMGNGWFTVE